ncbi:MAG: LysR family transcriptional regulator substrate-binding protein, partial [Duncaniella sp.]|nr:LysR family transcriptional regulator substrate-binding protein [Duncaniella sp.]
NNLAVIVGTHHPLASRKSVTIDDLNRFDLALPARGLQARNAFEAIVAPYIRLTPRIELNEVNILLKLIRQSMLVTILAEATIHNETGVVAIPLDIPDNEMAGCVHTLRNTYRKRSMQEFIRLLSESVAVRDRQTDWI